ncbi:hypothetical protein CO669_05185 [Bradyrhizobium sp. Y36]|uniref:ATP-binding cassette domain-containing protein n=1 Tax=Bradyrhizobium sp. Y36 TaxID=2035447 RepID=UPI000BE8C17F|nr:ATP-binding cassette domain-containing protein [Bradyrhizobium sp. Y36]PDT91399.1 hypothetical protein CO669_05185 [Bradyrhizobium sp. Y36]
MVDQIPEQQSDRIKRAASAEIEDLIAADEVLEALKKLRLLVADFGDTEQRSQVTLLLRSMNRAKSEERGGRTSTVNVNDVSQSALELVAQLISSDGVWSPEATARDPSRGQGYQGARPAPDSDQLRRQFIQSRKSSSGPSLVEADGLERQFPNGRFCLGPLSFKLGTGEVCVVIGKNGSGKSTLLRLVAGRLLPTAGSLSYPALSPTKDWFEIRSKVQFLSSRFFGTRAGIRPTLEFAASTAGKLGSDNERLVDDYLARYDLERYASRQWNELSDGYLMRFELVRALVSSPELLILDEPLANLDIVARLSFLSDLVELATTISKPTSVVLSTHHLDEAELVADKILILERGACIFSGTKADVRQRSPGSIFHLVGDLTRAAFGAVSIRGLRHVSSILGGVALHFDDFLTVAQLFERLGVLQNEHIVSVTDITESTKSILLNDGYSGPVDGTGDG